MLDKTEICDALTCSRAPSVVIVAGLDT